MKVKVIGLVMLLAMTAVLSACGNVKFKADYNYEMQEFEHINQRNETVSLESLKGKPWLGMYIFTNCTTVCTPMTFNMTQIQEKLIKKGIEDYNIVAFSVDPEVDTPEVLNDYLARYTVPDDSKWNLLTGYTQTYIEQYALKSTKQLVKKSPGEDQVTHMVTFFLVDKEGVLVKQYSGYNQDESEVPIDTMVGDIETYIEENL
ncbi:cysteine ABC transporter ATP-binding protein [Lysinibacillus contaminans]|uniref:Cysteine ABC transporter ATP-binding protein n=1 Tax=Lysinibacillus contaminans TaxID=1293441 RepID=A0ABR5K1M6_9BACI|nr:SCO family protein [Lysinibacillus contaminans]KOS68796.1 cysteine ABC transporter ATP-binding protein [Lysinibacillus contaminans]